MILEGRSKYVTDFYDLFACAHIDGGEGRLPPAVIDSIRPIEYPPLPLWIPPLERKPTTTLESATPISTKRVRSHFPSGISLSLSRPLTSTRFKKVYPSVIERGGGGLTSKEGFIESISVSPEQSSVKSYALIPSTFPANM